MAHSGLAKGSAALAMALTAWCFTVAPGMAADIRLISNHYSAERFVPHFAFSGPVLPGDANTLANLIAETLECDLAALPPEGGNCAVLTLHSPGGNYVEGLKLAQLLRDHAITSVVEAYAECYSACAFAFLGGSGYSSQDGVGAYGDRIVEPRGILGFHAPYFAPDDLDTLVAQHGMDTVLGASRHDIALMVQRLVDWNVDPNILGYIVSMGPDETYDVTTGEDYYLTRAHLPPSPIGHWISNAPAAIHNACLRLLAYHANSFVDEAPGALGTDFLTDFASNEFGQPLSGFRVGTDNPLGVTYCGLPTDQAALMGDVDLGLYTAPGVTGSARSMLTMFHRPDGWSTLGTGGSADRRIFKKGGLNAAFTEPFTDIEDQITDVLNYLGYQQFDSFNFGAMVDGKLPRPQSALPLVPRQDAHNANIFDYGDSRIMVHVGNTLLLENGRALFPQRHVTLDLESETDLGFVYGGTYPSGRPFLWFSLYAQNEQLVALIEIEAKNPPEDVQKSIREQQSIGCGMSFLGEALTCNW